MTMSRTNFLASSQVGFAMNGLCCTPEMAIPCMQFAVDHEAGAMIKDSIDTPWKAVNEVRRLIWKPAIWSYFVCMESGGDPNGAFTACHSSSDSRGVRFQSAIILR